MPAAAKQLLESGVTLARDLGAELQDSLDGARPHQQGRDPRSAPLRLGSLHPARALHRVGEGIPLGGQRPGRRPRQGPEDHRRRRRRREADRPGPDDRGGSEGRRRHGAQGRQARRRARAPRGRDPDRTEIRGRLLRAHGHRHGARLSRGHPGRDPQAQPDAGLVPDGRRRSSSRSTPPTPFPSG